MTDITNHLQTITKNIEAAASKANRGPHTVHLLAVSKPGRQKIFLKQPKRGNSLSVKTMNRKPSPKSSLSANPGRI